MAKKTYTDDDVMLTLASIAYGGFLRNQFERDELRARTNSLLRDLAPVKGGWELAWGPATFNAGMIGVDDAAVFAARSRAEPSRLAVVVRGTNPVSVFDWVFGDLVVARRVRWPYGIQDPFDGAKVSFSTALGLSIIRNLRGEIPPAVQTASEGGGEIVRWRLPSLGTWLSARLASLASDAVKSVRAKVDAALHDVNGGHLDPLEVLMEATALQEKLGHGTTLKEFLAGHVASSATPVRIDVTGHSKGGALCLAVGLWLAETRGVAAVPAAEQWDPTGKAAIHAYSFAGPTAGNAAFAARIKTALGDRSHRVFNTLDLVPHAWAASDLELVPTLYDLHLPERLALQGLSSELSMAAAPLGYEHAGVVTTALSPQRLQNKSLFENIVHQHMDGYFEAMGLLPDMSTATFFRL